MGGDIKYLAHVSQYTPVAFYEALGAKIEDCYRQDLYTEIQYQTTVEPTGRALFSAIVLGRTKEVEK